MFVILFTIVFLFGFSKKDKTRQQIVDMLYRFTPQDNDNFDDMIEFMKNTKDLPKYKI